LHKQKSTVLFAVGAAFTAALLVHLFVLPPGYLAAALYIVPVVLVARRGRRATAAVAVLGAAAVSWHAYAGGAPVVLWAAGVLALALVGYVAALVSSERRGAERQAHLLAQSEERFRLLVQGVEDYAIFLLDADGRVASWNTGAQRIKGYAESEVIGRPYAVFFTEEDARAGRPDRLLETARREGHAEDQGWRRRKDGSRFWADAVITALRGPSGELRGYAKVTRDATERRRADEERARHSAELEHRVEERTAALREINAELEAFSASVSHDLRAPLRAIQGFGEALLEDYGDQLDPGARQYAQRIVASVRRMDQLTEDILAYSRLSRADIQPHPVQLEHIVDDALTSLEETVRRSGASVTVERPLPAVHGHHATLVRVVANLLANALKFVPPGAAPVVRVHAGECAGAPGPPDEAPCVRLWVEDHGIGVPPEHSERIFNLLERLHGRETYPGNGIGLAIVRRAVERLGGRSGVEQAPSGGSRFWIELPAAAAPVGQAADHAAPAAPGSTGEWGAAA
jgi:PAS domain S-box-containing protein